MGEPSSQGVVMAKSPLEVIDIALKTDGLDPETRLQLLERKLSLLSQMKETGLPNQLSFLSISSGRSMSTDDTALSMPPTPPTCSSRDSFDGASHVLRGVPPAGRPKDGPRRRFQKPRSAEMPDQLNEDHLIEMLTHQHCKHNAKAFDPTFDGSILLDETVTSSVGIDLPEVPLSSRSTDSPSIRATPRPPSPGGRPSPLQHFRNQSPLQKSPSRGSFGAMSPLTPASPGIPGPPIRAALIMHSPKGGRIIRPSPPGTAEEATRPKDRDQEIERLQRQVQELLTEKTEWEAKRKELEAENRRLKEMLEKEVASDGGGTPSNSSMVESTGSGTFPPVPPSRSLRTPKPKLRRFSLPIQAGISTPSPSAATPEDELPSFRWHWQ